MSSNTFNCLVFFALIFSAEVGLVAAVSGPRDVDTDNLGKDSDIFRYASFALQALKENECPGGAIYLCGTGDGRLIVEKIESAQEQLVAGKNYHIECAISRSGKLSLSIFWQSSTKKVQLIKAELTEESSWRSKVTLAEPPSRSNPLAMDFEAFTSLTATAKNSGEVETDEEKKGVVGQESVAEKKGEGAEKTEAKTEKGNDSFLTVGREGGNEDATKKEEEKAAGGGLKAWILVLLFLLLCFSGGLFLFWQRTTKRRQALSGGLNR